MSCAEFGTSVWYNIFNLNEVNMFKSILMFLYMFLIKPLLDNNYGNNWQLIVFILIVGFVVISVIYNAIKDKLDKGENNGNN